MASSLPLSASPPEKSFVIDSLPAALSISGQIPSTDRKNGGISLTQKLNQFTKKLAQALLLPFKLNCY